MQSQLALLTLMVAMSAACKVEDRSRNRFSREASREVTQMADSSSKSQRDSGASGWDSKPSESTAHKGVAGGSAAKFGNNDFNLSRTDELELVHSANQGDGGAALRLYFFYEFVRDDQARSAKWLRVAAKNGNPIGQYNLALLLLENPTSKNVKQARSLLDRLAKDGNPDAKEKLESLPDPSVPGRHP
jgi:TPR repeat protein